MPLCNAGNCLALATHGSVCAVHAKHPVTTPSRRDAAELLALGIDYDFRPETYIAAPGDDGEDWISIATIALNDVLSDVVSIDANERFEDIELRVVDDTGGEYRWTPARVKRPFSLRELIASIDSARGPCGLGLVLGVLDCNRRDGGAGAAELERFVEVSSRFYPDLRRHYEAEVLRWIDAKD